MRRGLPDELRRRARSLRAVDIVPDRQAVVIEGTILAEIPAGLGQVLRVIWRTPTGRPPALSIRIWRETGHDGELAAVRDIGIEVPHYRLAALGEAIAEALGLAEDNVRQYRETRLGLADRQL